MTRVLIGMAFGFILGVASGAEHRAALTKLCDMGTVEACQSIHGTRGRP